MEGFILIMFRFLSAYIDPGSGSIILQAVIGTIAGIAYAIRHRIAILWGKITGKGKKPKKTED